MLFELRIKPSVFMFYGGAPGPPKPPPFALRGVEKASMGGGKKLSPGKICYGG